MTDEEISILHDLEDLGHEIGIHTMNHSKSDVLPSSAINQNQIQSFAESSGVMPSQLNSVAPYFDQKNVDKIVDNILDSENTILIYAHGIETGSLTVSFDVLMNYNRGYKWLLCQFLTQFLRSLGIRCDALKMRCEMLRRFKSYLRHHSKPKM